MPVTNPSLTEFFRELVQEAMSTHEVRSSEDTEFYLVKLLESFTHPERDWFERPLAVDYLESFNSPVMARYSKLKRVADTSLFLTGMFMEALERSLVGCDYYMALGRMAYQHLANEEPPPARGKPFAELSERFSDFVDVLSEISFNQLFRRQDQLVRVYTRWLYTGNRRDAQWLRRRGLVPVRGNTGRPQ
jgi:hypothetical protein